LNVQALPENLWVFLSVLSSAPAQQKGAAPSVIAIALPRLIEGDAMAKTEGASGIRFEIM